MRSQHPHEYSKPPTPKPPAISLGEILLIAGYFLAVWLIPVSWLETRLGSVMFAVARLINPYLSPQSVAFADDPMYFIHCHVLATWMILPGLPYSTIRKYGGREQLSLVFRKSFERVGGAGMHLLICIVFFGLGHFSMLLLVDYPLTGSERLTWISNIAMSSIILNGAAASAILFIYMNLFTIFQSRK